MTPEVPLLYSDAELLVVNKPAGLPTLPDGYQRAAPCLIDLLKSAFPPADRVWVVHRLDRDTSGVIVFARTAAAHRALNQAFEARQISKEYHALSALRGSQPAWEEYVIDLPLRPDGDRRHRTVIDQARGKPAVTRVRVLRRFAQHVLLAARPETGRTHQIRAHLAALQLPLAGDVLYGGEAALIARTALHARAISFEHPVTHAWLQFEAPYPADFCAALAQLSTQL